MVRNRNWTGGEWETRWNPSINEHERVYQVYDWDGTPLGEHTWKDALEEFGKERRFKEGFLSAIAPSMGDRAETSPWGTSIHLHKYAPMAKLEFMSEKPPSVLAKTKFSVYEASGKHVATLRDRDLFDIYGGRWTYEKGRITLCGTEEETGLYVVSSRFGRRASLRKGELDRVKQLVGAERVEEEGHHRYYLALEWDSLPPLYRELMVQDLMTNFVAGMERHADVLSGRKRPPSEAWPLKDRDGQRLCIISSDHLDRVGDLYMHGMLVEVDGGYMLAIRMKEIEPFMREILQKDMERDFVQSVQVYEGVILSHAYVTVVDSNRHVLTYLSPGEALEHNEWLQGDYVRRVSDWYYVLDFDVNRDRRLTRATSYGKSFDDLVAAYDKCVRELTLGDARDKEGRCAWEDAVRSTLLGWDEETVDFVVARMNGTNLRTLHMLLDSEYKRNPDRYEPIEKQEVRRAALALAWKHRGSGAINLDSIMSQAHIFEFDDDVYEIARGYDGPLEHLPFQVCIVEETLFWESYGIHSRALLEDADTVESRNLLSFVVNERTRHQSNAHGDSFSCDEKRARPRIEEEASDYGSPGVSRITYGRTRPGHTNVGGGPKAAHQRRGHYRMQAYGPNHSLRKKIWIKPTYVSPSGRSFVYDEMKVHRVVLGGATKR